MSTESAPVHLNSHHRETVKKIHQHPAGHNIEWRSVLSLLEAVGTVEEQRDGRYTVTIGGETETFERPKGKDIDTPMVVDLRRMLHNGGISALEATSSEN